MDLGEFREETKHFGNDCKLVISNIGDYDDIEINSCIDYTLEANNSKSKRKNNSYIAFMPNKRKQTFKEFCIYIKELFWDWFENNVDEETQENISFWLCPVGSFAPLDISLREMAGLPCLARIIWYNIHLLFFKIGGKLHKLSPKMQEYYDALEEYKKEKERG